MTPANNKLDEPEMSEVRKHFRRAVERVTADIAADPSDTDARIKRAVVHRILGEFDKAMQDYDALMVPIGEDPGVLQSKGITLLSLGELGAAAQAFDKANESDPWDVESYYRRVATRLALGENRRAIEVLDEFVDTFPRDAFGPGEWDLINSETESKGT